MPQFERVAVLGFGTMGAGIAQTVAASGAMVTVLDTSTDRVADGERRIAEVLDQKVENGTMTAADRGGILARIRGTSDMSTIADAQLVIETVSEDIDVKRSLLSEIAAVVDPSTVITSNTSALSVTELACSVPDPSRFVGLHFFNPAPVVKVVEVVAAEQTDRQVVTQVADFARAVGKEPLLVKDRPGSLVNRLLMPYLNDVIQAYDDELASAEDIDVALKLGLGYRMGPLEMLDLIGLDVHLAATSAAYEASHDPAYAPPPLLQNMVAAGRFGAKNGAGFRTDKEQA